jgi:hypothetical protein
MSPKQALKAKLPLSQAFSKILSLSILLKSKTDLLGKLNVCPPGVFFIRFFIFL